MARDPGHVSFTDLIPDELTFNCPRCAAEVAEPWYGPCDSCRVTLRDTLGGEARVVDAGGYVPKMNVTPNAVATKE